jgi:hypothetical protein
LLFEKLRSIYLLYENPDYICNRTKHAKWINKMTLNTQDYHPM